MAEHFKILIGYDGSEYAEAALDDLASAGLPDEADVFVATIAETLFPAPLSYGGVETGYVDKTLTGETQAREIAARGAEKLKRNFPGWTVEFDAAAGSASEILLTKADQWKPDLIVVGSQSRGAIGRFFFGSVAQSLVNNALCSVRVVRKPE
ncbi:MAG TPA: universal stress protein, partial [Pyrinomonadaceae bacterium]|nr:universal stress protein [Pyrinomonadaceae bacterium]